MRPQHQRTVDRLVAHFEPDPAFTALVVGGSIARGWERDDSDVDVLLVASDEEFDRRRKERAFHYYTTEFCDYPGGYVDGKIVDLGFLREVAGRGSDPARAAFVGAILAYSRLPEIAGLLERIPVYPEAQHRDRLQSFYAQMLVWQWYAGEAEKRGDRYLLLRSCSELVLFGGRLILAHNRLLYPYHKWFMQELERAPEKPAGLLAIARELLASPGKGAADRFVQCILDFADWEKPAEGWPGRFMEDTEWAWRRGAAPLGDC